jgi:hypothetical protein
VTLAAGTPHATSVRRRLAVVGLIALLTVLAGCSRPPGVDGDLANGWAAMPAPAYTTQAVGECYSGRTNLWFNVDFLGMILVNCAESHTAEVVAVREFVNGAAPAERPTTSTVAFQTAFRDCSSAVSSYLGADWHTAKAYPVVWLPSSGAWRTGNYHYTCAVAVDAMDDALPTPWKASVKDALRDPANPVAIGCVRVQGANPDKDGFYTKINAFQPVACNEPHDGEFTGAVEAPPGKYPTTPAEFQRFAPLCERAAIAFLGQTQAQWDKYASIRTMWTSPSEDKWRVEDRTVRCYVNVAATYPIGTSLRGLGGKPLPPKVG